jgi:hypothetical protein
MLMNREIISMIDRLVSSVMYAEIDWIINPQNNHITAFLLDFLPNGRNTTLILWEFRIDNMKFVKLE